MADEIDKFEIASININNLLLYKQCAIEFQPYLYQVGYSISSLYYTIPSFLEISLTIILESLTNDNILLMPLILELLDFIVNQSKF